MSEMVQSTMGLPLSENYPIDEAIPALRRAISPPGASAVLGAPPGAGKTTRVPLALIDHVEGNIVMLEPRRIAASSAARWMARTLGKRVGETVGYSIRFERKVSSRTRVEVVTEGILTRRLQSDPALEGVGLVIFDEFHERSLHADLALALLLDVKKAIREDIRVLVMSATLDTEAVSALLGGAPVVSSRGTAHPVEVRHMPLRGQRGFRETIAHTAHAVRTAIAECEGDVLVFLPGAGEIRALAGELGRIVGVEVHQLYGDLPFDQQERAIMPSGARRVVLATNIAETSLTIEGVGVVIDTGLARRLQYDPGRGMDRLITVNVSRASADQRCGRAGRIAPGVCYRLYSESEYRGLPPYSPPEITIADLAPMALELAAWGADTPSALMWMDPPPDAAWSGARELLRVLGALDARGRITELGRAMAAKPLHPRLGRLMMRAEEAGQAGLGADIAAVLSERDIMRAAPDADVEVRLDALHAWRRTGIAPDGADQRALERVNRTAGHLLGGRAKGKGARGYASLVARLLLDAYPDRIGKLRAGGEGRYLLANGRGVRLRAKGVTAMSPYIVAVDMDAGEGVEGVVNIAAPLTEDEIREELGARIERVRRVEWDADEGRVVGAVEDRAGSVVIGGTRRFQPSDEEAIPAICAAVRERFSMLALSDGARQLRARAALMRAAFPEEGWPDLSDAWLVEHVDEWLPQWLGGARSAAQLGRLDMNEAMRALIPWRLARSLDEAAPERITVPSGRSVALDYTAPEGPVLAVKLQEMFGLAETPRVARGRVTVLMHLLSPAGRPVAITRDLRGFWDGAYLDVKKEMKGRYPRHPWPDDPWNAPPTARTKRRA